jgi:hypothetical protein
MKNISRDCRDPLKHTFIQGDVRCIDHVQL